MIKRLMRHAMHGNFSVKSKFPKSSFAKIEKEIGKSENLHKGEIRFAVEASLNPDQIFKKISSRERAIKVFSDLGIWDTEDNTGVLIYLLLADRSVEIVADRGIHKKVGQGTWEEICRKMEAEFKKGNFEEGVIKGIQDITYYLAKYFPKLGFDNPDELSNRPVIV